MNPYMINVEIEGCGGKAAALAKLYAQGFPIPAWFVVMPDDCLDPQKLNVSLALLEGEKFAVRSSATAEDGAQHSFAGQFATYLNVPDSEVIQRIEDVRQSALSPQVLAYCEEHGIEKPSAPAVIVQCMIPSVFSGVAFSADPVHGHRSHVVICATEGTGDALVSGEVDGQRWVLDEMGRVISSDSKLLDDSLLQKIRELAQHCEGSFGKPQDIEWTVDLSGKLWLLQSRPITTLSFMPDPDDQIRVWDNSNIAESYCGVTTPMTFSFARRIYESVYREFCALMSVPKDRIQRGDDVFPQMLGLIRGRVYYNLLSWYRVLAMLPGFQMNRAFMETMMGVKEPLPDDLVQQVVSETQGNRIRDGIALMSSCFGLFRQWWGLDRQVKEFNHRLQEALALPNLSYEHARGEVLVAAYRTLERRLLKRWDAPLVNDFFAMIFYGLLTSICKKWLPEKGENFQNELLLDGGDMISGEPPKRMREMAQCLRSDPQLAEMLANSDISWRQKQGALKKMPQLNQLYEAYLSDFGDRCMEELKLESMTVRDDPSALLLSIGVMAMQSQTAELPAAVAKSKVDLTGLKGFAFRFVLAQARKLVLCRENLRFQRTLLFGRVRTLIREMGKRLVADGSLEHTDDVFYLEISELLGAWEGVNSTTSLQDLVQVRRRDFLLHAQSDAPPDRLVTHGPLHRYAHFTANKNQASGEIAYKGVGASPGIVRGRVRVVMNPREASLQAGEILVAQQTDPGWVVLFPLAAGLLVERGSLLSHSAIVSREMRLPCIVSLPGITQRLKTGDWVEMNGATGEIRSIKDEDGSTIQS